MKYLGEGRIQDSRGKVWFFSRIKPEDSELVDSIRNPRTAKNTLIAVSEKWAVDTKSVEVQSRFREWESISIPFQEIIVKTKPFERIVNIIF
ncbi:MAG: hypothetical protein RR494_02670 [Vagococcus sp.]|uniref:hypothetical protein n=1 Tax=Vagococcus sp. TaxID=1933889 RepID=UPI002FCB00C7